MPIPRHEAIQMVLAELDRAHTLHPKWPKDRIHQAAIVQEEAGELIQATLQDQYEHNKRANNPIKEATQTAAMAIRFLEETP